MNLIANVTAFVVVVGCATTVVRGVAKAPMPRARPSASALERARLAHSIEVEEADWRRKSQEDFVADLWSQRDAFHGHEAAQVRALASSSARSYEDILRGIDENIRRDKARAVDRGAAAVPCKPRPFYD